MSRSITAASKAKLQPPTFQSKIARKAAQFPIGHPYRRRLLKYALAPRHRRIAGKWEEAALEALAEEEDVDVDDFRTGKGPDRNSFTAELGRREWLVFKDERDAEKYAIEYVRDMLNDEPGLFTSDWLRGFITMSKGDAREIALEDASSYVEDIRDEDDGLRVVQEANMEAEWDEIEEATWDLDNEDPPPDDYDKQLQALEDRKEKLVEKAAEELEDRMSSDTEDEILSDPLGWYEERFGKLDMNKLPSFFFLDIEEAAQDAVSMDSVAHFLSGYDGNEIDLGRSGAVAYRTN